ncbi:MAG: rhamnulokinase family protein [Clostridia bacterium]|nr:rhamnulokinase family protein [Clostridia bacterium]
MVKVLGFDYGASSGRAMLGIFDGEKVTLEEVHRFSNDPVNINGTMYWDVLRLFHELKTGIIECRKKGHGDISSIAVDTWGVDFGLLDKEGRLLENPVHYRDSRTDGMIDAACEVVPREEIYRRTGIQFMQFNTLYQLYSLSKNRPDLLERADKMLFMPDLLNYFLTGSMHSEYSIASTAQMLDINTGDWDRELLDKLGIPHHFLADIIDGGTVVGMLKDEICDEVQIDPVPVISVAAHDTGSAVISAPAETDNFAFLSSGTWSLLGTELKKPIVSDMAAELEYSNEGGFNRTIRFLKNIMGLWIYQDCRRQWNREGKVMSFDELEFAACEAEPFRSLIDPDNDIFYHHGHMPENVQEFCKNTGQLIPETKPQMVKCIMESLALKYRYVFEGLEKVVGREIPKLHIVGGGCKNIMLSQFAANALGKTITTGPIEATSTGNIMAQLIALKHLSGMEEARKVIRNSFEIKEWEPQDVEKWDEVYNFFVENVVGRGQ